ncbi:MAG: DUF3604 domain-containing protein [Planctomycetales bacterium]
MTFRRAVVPVLCCLWIVAIAQVAPAHPGHSHAKGEPQHPPEGQPDFFYDRADESIEGTLFDGPNRYDTDVLSADGKLWYAWLEFTPRDGDKVWVGTYARGEWTQKTLVTNQPGDYACPTLTRDSTGRVWLSYEAAPEKQWDVFAVPLRDGRPDGEPTRISPGGGADIQHAVAADRNGGLWFVWQSDRDGQFDVLARRVAGISLDEPAVVSRNGYGDWHPEVAVGADGSVHVVWDAFDGTSFNVHLRTLAKGEWGDVVDVARTSAFEGRAQVAIDGKGRVWIAWEEGGENWGMPYRGIDTNTLRDTIGPLHRLRKLRLALLKDGRPRLIHDQLPMASFQWAEERKPDKPGAIVKRVGAFYERARLCVDDAGRLWVAYRHNYTPWLGYTHRGHVEGGFGVFARCLGDEGWSPLYRVDEVQGDGMQRLEIAPHSGGIAVAWTIGRTDRRRTGRKRGVLAATIYSNEKPAGEIELEEEAPATAGSSAQQPERISDGRPPRPAPVTVAGKQYQLFFGDLHRHTDLSLCRVATDGSIDDAYRYAIEPAGLDFLGITDHSRDIAMGEHLSQLWWRSRKEVERHRLGTTFFPFYAYERSHGDTADHNVISLRDDMLRPYTYPVPKFWTELDADTLTIPHQPIRRLTWSYQDDLLRPLVEIFQGCRDASIEKDVREGLSKGYHLGFIASSDHQSTSASYACVWAEEESRESIFRALQARRTFAATVPIRVKLLAGEHWMGEIVDADKLPPLHLEATGTAPVKTVTMVVDGKPVKTLSPNSREVRLSESLDLKRGQYVYFHLVQEDGNEAWTSPVWLKATDESDVAAEAAGR